MAIADDPIRQLVQQLPAYVEALRAEPDPPPGGVWLARVMARALERGLKGQPVEGPELDVLIGELRDAGRYRLERQGSDRYAQERTHWLTVLEAWRQDLDDPLSLARRLRLTTAICQSLEISLRAARGARAHLICEGYLEQQLSIGQLAELAGLSRSRIAQIVGRRRR